MFRFFVNEKVNNSFILTPDILKHIKVIRIKNKNFICIYEGKFFICKLVNDVAEIISEMNESHEHDGEVIIAAAIIDIKRFEWLIQKAAELGATKLIPFYSERVVKKIPGDISKKILRWNTISLNASEQSFRNIPMEVATPINFDEVIKLDIKNKYIAHEKINNEKVKEFFEINSLFMVGPEGGFTDLEISKALENNFETISLGKRILRAETASMFLLSRITQN